MTEVGILDWGLWLIYLVVIWLLMFIYKNGKTDHGLHRYFMPAFLVKVVGGVAFILVYIYYYGFGDTHLYHSGASILADTLAHDPSTYFRLLFSENGNLPNDLQAYTSLIPYSRTKEEWFMVKLMSPLNFISFNSYLIATLLISTVSFYGSWKLFRVVADIFSKRKDLCFLIVFLLPSTLFWGSGILKDTISMAAINIVIFCSYFLFFKEEFKTKYFILLIFASLLLINLKLYILLSFLPGLSLGIYLKIKEKISSQAVRLTMTPVLLGVIIGASYYIVLNLDEINNKYAIDSLEKQTRGFHTWHATTAGSAYNLGEIEYTAIGVAQKIPAALNVTFFRPYIWESRNVVMLIGSLESMALLGLFLYLLFSQGLKMVREISKDPFIGSLVIYILIFGFAIGFTSYNFGALSRYKIPIHSLIFFVVLYLIDKGHRHVIQEAESS